MEIISIIYEMFLFIGFWILFYDVLHIWDKFEYWLFYKIYTQKTSYKPFWIKIKPIGCSVCSVQWSLMIYLNIFHPISIYTILTPFLGALITFIIKTKTLY